MLHKRLASLVRLGGPRTYIYTRCCSTKPPKETEETPNNQSESKLEQTENQSPKYNPRDKINSILKLMIEENAQRGSQKFESKFPNINKGFKQSQLPADRFKSDDSEELKLKRAASAVAESLDNREQIERDLLSKAMDIREAVNINWSELITGMKIDHKEQEGSTRAAEIKKLMKTSVVRQPTERKQFSANRSQQMERVNLLDNSDLGIFQNIENHNHGTELKMWDYLKENELSIATSHPPTNYYEKMIMWTNEGKIWKFPIDNEQGMEEEQSVHFSDHVFLEPHLEGWCPTRGPIRHFMELVCVGLSKNPYFSVQEKIDHIMWYKEYFGSKTELLQQTGSLQDGFSDRVQEINK